MSAFKVKSLGLRVGSLVVTTQLAACSGAADPSQASPAGYDASVDVSVPPGDVADAAPPNGEESLEASTLGHPSPAVPDDASDAKGMSLADDAATDTDTGYAPADSGFASRGGNDASQPGSCASGMVRIPSKNQSFMMGFNRSEAPGTIWACYLGKHKVTFTHDLCMDAKLVTQAEFSKVMGFNPSGHVTADPTLPVDSETWFDAILYCNKRSQMEGLQPAYTFGAVTMTGMSATNIADVKVDVTKNGYRLPTNAEYEYAERANTTGYYFFSPMTLLPVTNGAEQATVTALGGVVAWYSVNSKKLSQPVGQLKPNPFGLYDIVGNLFEWENDWEGPYVTTDEIDPIGPPDGLTGCGFGFPGIQRMAKGGSWNTDVVTHMRISYHYRWPPAAVHKELGFRCVSTGS